MPNHDSPYHKQLGTRNSLQNQALLRGPLMHQMLSKQLSGYQVLRWRLKRGHNGDTAQQRFFYLQNIALKSQIKPFS